MAYNASDTRQIRAAEKLARVRDAGAELVILTFLGDPSRRAYIYDLLSRAHIFTSSFSPNPYHTAFAEGERNIGLQLLADIQRFAPDAYIQMMREAQDRETSHERRDSRPERSEPRGGWDDSALANAGSVDSEYDPDPAA